MAISTERCKDEAHHAKKTIEVDVHDIAIGRIDKYVLSMAIAETVETVLRTELHTILLLEGTHPSTKPTIDMTAAVLP